MRLTLIIILAGVLLMAPRLSEAQHGGNQSQHKVKSSTMKAPMGMMQGNMALMAEITDEMQQMMSTGRMSPEQQSHILNMMKKMSRMMREMAVPHGEEVKKRHNQELHKILNELDSF